MYVCIPTVSSCSQIWTTSCNMHDNEQKQSMYLEYDATFMDCHLQLWKEYHFRRGLCVATSAVSSSWRGSLSEHFSMASPRQYHTCLSTAATGTLQTPPCQQQLPCPPQWPLTSRYTSLWSISRSAVIHFQWPRESWCMLMQIEE